MKKLTRNRLFILCVFVMLSVPGFSQGTFFGTGIKTHQAPANRNGGVLYDQLDQIGDGFMSSHHFTDPGSAANTTYAADDFIVPAGETWEVSYVDLAGAYFAWTGTAIEALNLIFYEDNGGMPGSEIHTLNGLTGYNELLLDAGVHLTKYEIMLPSALTFTEGHYWIGVQAVSDNNVTGQWGWCTHVDVTIEAEYHWKNPGDGFGTGFTDWTPASFITWGDMNLAFALYGEGMDNDLALLSIDSPVTAPGLTAAEQVSVSLKNEGTIPVTGFNVSYSINGGSAVSENVGSFTLNANQIGTYTFTTPAGFSAPGPYQIAASVSAAGDPRPENNTSEKTIYNLGTVYTMPSTGMQTITSCGATFTDSGGLDGNFGDFDNAVTTLFPANPGDRIRLTFLEFDASWGGFSIYNGPDTLAPLMGTWFGTNSPGEVNALNVSGTLTIRFKGPQWENTPGWVAYISCVTPVTDDFAVLDLKCSLPTLFVGDVPQLSAKIQNYGTLTQEKTVTFKANGVEIGTAMTGLLGPADTTWVSVAWAPEVDGDYILEASIPEDLGADQNNFAFLEAHVFPFGAFYEDFEAGVFPPENWRHGGGWALSTDPFSGNYNANCFVAYNKSDTLISPRLSVEPDGILTFAAKTTMWWPGNLDLYWFDESARTWSFVQNVPLNIFSYDLIDVDLSAFTGVGRIGFFVNVTDPYAFSGSVHIDQVIGSGITVYSDNYDLKAKELAGNDFYNVNEPLSFTFTIRNDGLMDVPAGVYTVRLMQDGPVPAELASVTGNAIASHEVQTYNFDITLTSVDQFPIHAIVDYSADEYLLNNTSPQIILHGLAGASEAIRVGEDVIYANWPIEFTTKKSLSETIYTHEEINRTGVIFGIGYDYFFAKDELSAPVRIWMGETDTLNLMTWIPATEMTLVFDGLLDIAKGRHSVYIPFHTPFNYSDATKNLIILTERVGDHSHPDQFYLGYGSMYMSTLVTASDVAIPDPFDPPLTGGMSTNINPNIRFVFNDNLGLASGTVSEAGGNPIEGAKVMIDDLKITAYTDASGNYEMPYVPAGEYNATADKFAYMPVTQPLGVSNGNTTDLDFTLGLLELISITGNITGDNDPGTGIADAVITLTGYSNFNTTSNSGGDFTIQDVYSFQTYQLTIDADGYDVYTDQVVVSDSDLDLGDIVLTETMLIPFAVMAQPGMDQADIHWSVPSESAQTVLAFDDGVNENGYAGEPNEEVWLGNYFPIEEVTTITGFELYWASYGLSTQQLMRLDVFDDQNKIVVSSEPFMSGLDEWLHIDIPNITLQGDYYVMISWSGLFTQSTFLAFDTTDVTPDYAYYRYPNGNFQLLSNLTGQQGTFLIHANAMTEPGDRISGRSVNSYNISMGTLDDIVNAESWPLLNEEPLMTNTFTDLNWPPMVSGKYVYAVKALYTNGESELSFSNILNFVYVSNSYVAAPELLVYPNPAAGVVTISGAENAELVVYGMDGRVCLTGMIDSDTYRLDVSRLVRGPYMLTIRQGDEVKRQKLLVN